HRFAERRQRLVEFALPLGRANAIQLFADGGEERFASQVGALVEVIANAHAEGIEWRGLGREPSDENGNDVRAEKCQVFEKPQAVEPGTEVPVQNCQVDGMFVGDLQGGFGIRGCEYLHIEPGPAQPFLEGPADRFLVVHNQNGIGHGRSLASSCDVNAARKSRFKRNATAFSRLRSPPRRSFTASSRDCKASSYRASPSMRRESCMRS